MKDAVTIVVLYISRQQGQSLLNVDQDFRLKAGADFLQSIDKPRHFVGPDLAIQSKPIEPAISPALRQAYPAPSHYAGLAPRLLIFRSMVSDLFIGG